MKEHIDRESRLEPGPLASTWTATTSYSHRQRRRLIEDKHSSIDVLFNRRLQNVLLQTHALIVYSMCNEPRDYFESVHPANSLLGRPLAP